MENNSASPWSILGRNLLALALFWILAFTFVQTGQRMLGGWPASEVGKLLACVVGTAIALRTKATVAGFLLAGMTAVTVSELLVHSFYGIRAAQGAPTHLAVLGAGMLGVALGTWLMRRDRWLSPLNPARRG
jgi:hypothetical protein